jgi:hypothetical protein
MVETQTRSLETQPTRQAAGSTLAAYEDAV